MVALSWQDAVFFACDVVFFADLALYAKAPEKPHPVWRSWVNAALLVVCAATGWTLDLRAWAVLTVASAATWGLIARRNAARIAAAKRTVEPPAEGAAESAQIATTAPRAGGST